VRDAVRRALADLAAGDRVLVACSGGPDSLALLGATVVVGGRAGLLVGAVVVDHGLQPGSAEVALRVAGQAGILGCRDVRVVRVQVRSGPGAGGPEAAARAARYGALAAQADSADGPAEAVLLGHTREDQAEGVLLGLARGSGTRSLAGMAPRCGVYRRPLLDLPRAVVAAAAAQQSAADPRLEPWRDPHNEDPAFARVRVRRSALPALEQALGPGVVEALARTARAARADADALDEWADAVLAQLVPAGPADGPGTRAVPVQRLLGVGSPLPAAVTTRVVRRLLLGWGCPAGGLTLEHVTRVADLLAGPATRAEVALPGGLRARREGPDLVVRA